MTWRVALSLLTLRDQLDAAFPDRSRASDGTIGDAAHQAQVSDHNPDAAGVVRALDITHDPENGCDIDALSDALIGSRDPRISYVIANRLISGPDHGWAWADYGGDDPHTGHLHLSVVGDGRADDQRPWNIGGDDMTPEQDRLLRNTERILTCWSSGRKPYGVDYGDGKPLTLANPLAELLARPAPSPTLTPEQLTQLGAAAASEAATILGDRLEAVEEQLARIVAAMGAGATAELETLGDTPGPVTR